LKEGRAPACVGLADLRGASESGHSGLPPRAALEALEHGCDAGNLLACERLGALLMDRGLWPDKERAVEVSRRACLRGSGPACFRVGQALYEGDGAKRDEALAIRMYRRACRLHDADACLNAGTMQLRSRSRLGDTEGAYAAFLWACVMGRQDACVEMTRTASPAGRAAIPEP
jgi:TPR repeat protein